MERLADIEVQLCMHGLTSQELLQFARCNRALCHASDSAFAWRFTSVQVKFELNGRSEPSRFQRFRRGLRSLLQSRPPALPLSHPRVCALHLSIRKRETTRSDTDALFALLASHSHLQLHELNLLGNFFLLNDCNRLLSHSAFQSLRAIRTGGRFCRGSTPHADEETMRLIASMPHLCTLELFFWPQSILPLLTPPAALTSLRVISTIYLPEIAQCSTLAHLHVHQSGSVREELFRAFFASALMQRNLQSLTLHHLEGEGSFMPHVPQRMESCMASLMGLRTLQLSASSQIDQLLPHLARLPALRRLIVTQIQHRHQSLRDGFPDPFLLMELLTARPKLVCCILLDVHDESCDSDRGPHFLRMTQRHYGAAVRGKVRRRLRIILNDAHMWRKSQHQS